MKKLLFILAASLCAFPLAAQTADEIIAGHIKARGGENWREIKTLKIEGTYTAFSMPAPYTLVRARPGNKMLLNTQMSKRQFTLGAQDDKLWWIHEGQSGLTPVHVTDRNYMHRIQETDFFTPFFDYKERGYTLEYQGVDELEGVRGHKFKLTRAEGHEEFWFLDTETLLEAARSGPASDYGRPHTMLTFFDDFREVNGAMIPHYTEYNWHTRQRLMEISKVEVNAEVDHNIFNKPLSAPLQPLAALVGAWDLDIAVTPRPGAPAQKSKGSTTIELQGADSLFVERGDITAFRGPMSVMRTLGWDPAGNRYLLTDFNTVARRTGVMWGAMTDGVLSLDTVQSETPWMLGSNVVHDKIEIKDITADGFQMVLSFSVDQGKTWNPHTTCTYQRRKES